MPGARYTGALCAASVRVEAAPGVNTSPPGAPLAIRVRVFSPPTPLFWYCS
jgi:hypothetical protein